ncbi:MAG TPA: protein-L-isoaspartate O-methyltransferase, partial [Tenuifilaceae bacterium]|nr:protein-L-isoaspartate O-methyltransferase [Tenuifilaceae bacterium]
ITAAAPEIPQALVDQLEVGGRMVLPLGDTMGQDMTLVEKISPTETRVTAHGRFIFVPMLKGTQR